MAPKDIMQTTKKLHEAYKEYEIYWRQKSKTLWLKDIDKNTKYSHAFTKQRTARNIITYLFNDDGDWKESE